MNGRNGAASLAPDAALPPDAIHMDHLLDADGVGEWLHVPPTWVRREARAGRMPSIRLGHYVRFEREAVRAYLETLKEGGR